MRASSRLRYVVTAVILLVAIVVARYLWNDNMYSPWTRDGRVKADVINIAADVSGIVTSVAVRDNQLVHKGDLLFTIDKSRYANTLAQTEAELASQQADKTMRSREAARRAGLDSSIVTSENRETAASLSSMAGARYLAVLAARDTARLNLERTEVRAPVDGYVTNLRVYVGDYASAGSAKLAVIDSNSFYVFGYFEETKLPYLAVNDPVEVRMLDGQATLTGHIESISRGITDRDAATGRELLADVNPTFNWVRLAQRVPVRVRLDKLPEGRMLVAGTTCTVVVKAASSAGG
ncbi:MAG: HlyD family secretion protein [Rhodocyclaceae bacterium]|nr:HlyD family secretion protein [Rhodocyclaceae bacterium]